MFDLLLLTCNLLRGLAIEVNVKSTVRFCIFEEKWNTVEPHSVDTHLIRTPALYRQFRLSRQKAHIFSLKLTRFIRTPVKTDNGHFCAPSHKLSYIVNPALQTLVISALSIFNVTIM